MSAILFVLKGPMEGQKFSLTQGKTVLGRNPECSITIPDGAVSRSHACILRENGRFFLEDLESRNKTYLNDVEVKPHERRELMASDVIRICSTIAEFRLEPEVRPTIEASAEEAEENGAEEGSTTVEATLQHSSSVLFETHPADKLHSLLEISAALGRTLELEGLLPKIVDSLFAMFKQADRCFVIQHDQDNDRLIPKLVRTRRPQDEDTARFSRTIVRECMKSKQLFLSNDAGNHPGLESQSVVDFRIRSVMCAPLIAADGRAFGVIQLDTQIPSRKFTREDMQLLMGVANQAAIALENARLYREGQHRARQEEATRTARKVQLSFLPKRMPEVPGYKFFAHYEAAENVGVVPAERFQNPFLLRPEKLLVEFRSDHARGRVAHPHGVRPRGDLCRSVGDGHVGRERKQIAGEHRVVDEVEHDGVHASQLGREGERPLDPADNRHAGAGRGAHELDRFDPVVHPASAERVGETEGLQPGFVAQRGPLLVDRGTLVCEPVDARAARDVDDLARRIGAGQQAVEPEILDQFELGFGHFPAVLGVVDERDAGVARRKHHRHGLGGQAVDRLAADDAADALARGQRAHRNAPVDSGDSKCFIRAFCKEFEEMSTDRRSGRF